LENGDEDDDEDEVESRSMESESCDFECFHPSLTTILENGDEDEEVAESIESTVWDLESLVESEAEPGQRRASLSAISGEGDQDVNLAVEEEEGAAENLPPLLRRSARIAALPVVNYKESPYRPPNRRKKSKLRRSSRLAKLVPVRYEA
jgi:hypothetical protein